MDKETRNSIKLPEKNKRDKKKYDKKYKAIIIGNSGVGKTCLVFKALKDRFAETYKSTLGFEYYNIIAEINDKKILLQTWDTCGQEVFHSIINTFYKRCHICILVYAINDRKSFEGLDFWLNEIKTNSVPDVKIILVGNKSDLSESRVVTYEEGNQFCTNNNLTMFLEASAKEGDNAREVFLKSAQLIYDYDMHGEVSMNRDGNVGGFNLDDEKEKEDGKSCDECF